MIEVLAPGMFTTVQDLGRCGFGPLGVSPSGAADAVSLRLGNRLVGNPDNAAALEMTLLGGTFRFLDAAIVALTGAPCAAAKLDDAPIVSWQSFAIMAGSVLELGPSQTGARCYLAVRGGIAVPPFLGSASTHTLSGTGGFHGRPLKKGDVLSFGKTNTPFRQFRKNVVSTAALQRLVPRKLLRVTPAPQANWFSGDAQKEFYGATYRVTEECNRLGIRLQGSPLAVEGGRGLLSEGVPLGAVQITAAGLPILLFVEQQTTGGYPKIANVISADLHSLGQLRPRDEIRFELVDFATAHQLLVEQENLLQSPALLQQ